MDREELTNYLNNLKVIIEEFGRKEREYHDRQHEETRALIRSVYGELRGPR